jgi:hypothetical protein
MRESFERACERLMNDITKTVRYYGAQERSFDIHKMLVCGGFALVASDEVIIPVQTHYYALEGLRQLLETVDIVKKRFNQDLEIPS